MEILAREDVLSVLKSFGVARACRATTVDETEEVIFISAEDFSALETNNRRDDLTLALMDVLPHQKVWLAAEHPRWTTEPL